MVHKLLLVFTQLYICATSLCRFISRSNKLPQISHLFTQQLQVSAAGQDAAIATSSSTVNAPTTSTNGTAASNTLEGAGSETAAAAAVAAESFRVVDVPYYQLVRPSQGVSQC
jgi:hypothetical protein